MEFGKIIAVIGLIVFAWWAYPLVSRGEWFAPTVLPPGYWGLAEAPEFEPLSEPSQGVGIYHYDVWNHPPTTGRPVIHRDIQAPWNR